MSLLSLPLFSSSYRIVLTGACIPNDTGQEGCYGGVSHRIRQDAGVPSTRSTGAAPSMWCCHPNSDQNALLQTLTGNHIPIGAEETGGTRWIRRQAAKTSCDCAVTYQRAHGADSRSISATITSCEAQNRRSEHRYQVCTRLDALASCTTSSHSYAHHQLLLIQCRWGASALSKLCRFFFTVLLTLWCTQACLC